MVSAISAQSYNNKIDKNVILTTVKGSVDPLQKQEENDDKFISTCSDGKDDGKLSFKEKIGAFGRGVVNHFSEGFRNLKNLIVKHPVESVLAAGACLALGTLAISAFGAPFVLGALSAGGFVMGVKGMIDSGKGIISSFNAAKNAQTDAGAKQAIYDLGGNSAGFVESAVLTRTSAKGVLNAAKALNQADDYARILSQSDDNVVRNMDDLMKKMKDGTLTPQEEEILESFLDEGQNVLERMLQLKPEDVQNPSLGKLVKLGFSGVNE